MCYVDAAGTWRPRSSMAQIRQRPGRTRYILRELKLNLGLSQPSPIESAVSAEAGRQSGSDVANEERLFGSQNHADSPPNDNRRRHQEVVPQFVAPLMDRRPLAKEISGRE